MRLWNWIAMAGLIGGMSALPVRAQDCYPASGDSYLYADGQGDVYGYSTTYNICQDPSMSVLVYGNLEEAGGYVLDAESDEEDTGNDATAYTAATVFYGDYYQQWGYHYYDYCDSGWLPASPSSTFYTVWSDPPNPVPTVTRTWPDDSGGIPTWTPGGGPDNGAYEVAFSGWDLTNEIPTVTDTGCSSAYSVSAWQTADSAVWANVTILSFPVSACSVSFSLVGALFQVLLSPPPTFAVVYSAYIPVDHVNGPLPCFLYGLDPIGKIYKGDANRGTSRVFQSLTIVPDAGLQFNPVNVTGLTDNYGFGSPVNGSTLSQLDEDGIASDCYLWNLEGHASTGAMSVSSAFPQPHLGFANTSGQASNPLEAVADWAPIQLSVATSIDTSVPNSPTATVNYSHTCYPAHYVAVNGSTIYSYTPPSNDLLYITGCLFAGPTVNGIVGPVPVPY